MKALSAGIFILLSQFTMAIFGQEADPLDNWYVRANYSLNSIAFGNDVFVAVGPNNTLVTSTNGVIWTRVITPRPVWDGYVGFLKDFFMTWSGSGEAMVSTNGLRWFLTGRSNAFYSVAAAPDRFVAVSHDGALLSYDGIDWNWTIAQSGASLPLKEVAFGNSLFVATSESGGAIVSTDGIAWTYSLLYSDACCSLAFGNGIFVMMSGVYVTSSVDGVHWSRDQILPYDRNSAWGYRDVTFGAGRFVAVGIGPISAATDLTSNVVSSVDGVGWKWHGTLGNQELNSVTFGQRTFVAVGNRFIIQSAPLTNAALAQPTLRLDSYAGVRIDGPAGKWYQIERTDDLRDTNSYVAVTNIFLPQTPATWVDFDSPNARKRFYRAVILP